MRIAGKWGISDTGERYEGMYDTRDEAKAAAKHGQYIGQYREPVLPEECWSAEDWIDHVLCQDDYCHDCAEGCLDATEEQRCELELYVRAVLGAWLDKHGLRPEFGLVEDSEVVYKECGDFIAADWAGEEEK